MKNKTLSASYISSFCMELYLILQAGITLTEGMEILCEGEPDQANKQALLLAVASMQEGEPLCDALLKTAAFPKYVTDMVRVSEETGNLDRGLKALSVYYERRAQLEQNIRRAVLYPAVLLCMLTAVLVVLIVEVLPMFNDVYSQLGGTLTGLGAVILDFGTLLRAHWVAAVVIVIALLAIATTFITLGQKSGLRVLLSKKLGMSVATAKLASVLAMSLHSGLDTDSAMEMAENLTEHPVLRRKIALCRQELESGEGFALAINKVGIFSGLNCRMLDVGIRTGAIDEVMDDIDRRCDTETQDAIERYIGSVEPTLVMIMSILVGVVLLSVMLPLAGIMTALG